MFGDVERRRDLLNPFDLFAMGRFDFVVFVIVLLFGCDHGLVVVVVHDKVVLFFVFVIVWMFLGIKFGFLVVLEFKFVFGI